MNPTGATSRRVGVVVTGQPRPKSQAEVDAENAIYDGAFRVIDLLGRYGSAQILCRPCARTYTDGMDHEVAPATKKEVSDAELGISEDLIGRIGPVGDRQIACFECEAEL